MSDISERFELLIFEDAEAYLKRRVVEKAIEEKKAEKLRIKEEKEAIILHEEVKAYKRKIERKGVCESCGNGGFDEERLRWVRNDEFYVCYECFIHDLDCEASVMVPTYRLVDMQEYVSEYLWDEYWEEEQEEKKEYCIDVCKSCRDVYHGDYFCDFHECPLEDVIIELCEKR